MANLYPPYLEGTLPAFCLVDVYGVEKFKPDLTYDKGDNAFIEQELEDGSKIKRYYKSITFNNMGHTPDISADYWQEYNEGDGEIIIPFSHNKAVSPNDVRNISVKVKTVQNDELLIGGIKGEYDPDNCLVRLKVKNYNVLKKEIIKNTDKDFYEEQEIASNWTVTVGQFYKIQIAYIANDDYETEGFYSTVGVIKCTSTPRVTIQGLEKNGVINSSKTEFIGKFQQVPGSDIVEKVYSSSFVVKDSEGNVIKESGECLHNVQNNPDSYISTDTFKFNQDLPIGDLYTIQYNVITNNNLHISSEEYWITQQLALSADLKSSLSATFNYEDGYTQINLIGYVDESGQEEWGDGIFILSREDSLNPNVWEELFVFSLNYEPPTRSLFKDFTVEQGKYYTYSIQRINKHGVYSDRIKSNTIYADFEDLFIYDGQRQLKIRFNPQVNNIKTQLSESKVDTIGSKYPFFFRNARVGYKILPVSGLISMLSDDNEFFTTYEDILRSRGGNRERHYSYAIESAKKSTSLHDGISYSESSSDNFVTKKHKEKIPSNFLEPNAQNYASERLFKMKVLDWFNDGKTKLFRSPAEGNFLVRFMETSLSPNPTLGRMIHTLNTTGYECAECSYENFLKFNIIENNEYTSADFEYRVEAWREENLFNENTLQVKFDKGISKNLIKHETGNKIYTSWIKFMDFIPGTEFILVFDPSGLYGSENCEVITIGASGQYELSNIAPVYGIYLKENDIYKQRPYITSSGKMLYQYKTALENTFDDIVDAKTNTSNYYQLIGNTVVPEFYNDKRRTMANISIGKFYKRPIEYLYYDSNNQSILNSIQDKVSYGNDFPLYYDYSFNNKDLYSQEENMVRSPFCIYVLRNDIVNGQKIKDTVPAKLGNTLASDQNSTIQHAIKDNHIFERYYIDQLMSNEPTAEEVLLAALAGNDSSIILLDAWTNTLYPATQYNCTLQIREKEINLFNLGYYEIDNFFVTNNNTIKMNNGIYGEIYFQSLEKTYTFEDTIESKQVWKDFVNLLKSDGRTITNADLETEHQYYSQYLADLTAKINSINNKEENVEGGI